MTRLYLIRHCEPEPDAFGRCYGSLDFGLSAGGRAQADELAAAFAGVALDAVISSPRRRALETAAPLAAQAGLEVRPDERLRELDFGELEGLTYDEVAESRPELFGRWMETPTEVEFPGGESYALLHARVLPAVEALDGVCALVTHGGPIRAVLAEWLGMPPAAIFRLDQSYAGVTVVDRIEGTPLVRAVNSAPAGIRRIVPPAGTRAAG